MNVLGVWPNRQRAHKGKIKRAGAIYPEEDTLKRSEQAHFPSLTPAARGRGRALQRLTSQGPRGQWGEVAGSCLHAEHLKCEWLLLWGTGLSTMESIQQRPNGNLSVIWGDFWIEQDPIRRSQKALETLRLRMRVLSFFKKVRNAILVFLPSRENQQGT